MEHTRPETFKIRAHEDKGTHKPEDPRYKTYKTWNTQDLWCTDLGAQKTSPVHNFEHTRL